MFLTLVRFPLVVFFFFGAILFIKYPDPWLFNLSLGMLIASAVTDIFDGYFARRFQVETKMGAHADPLMDKFFYLCTLPLLIFVTTHNNHIDHAIFILIICVLFLARDQWVTFLRSIGSMYNISGGANWAGKLRTIVNFPLICSIYYYEEAPTNYLINKMLLHTVEVLAVVINFVSLYIYSKKYWPYLRKSADIEE